MDVELLAVDDQPALQCEENDSATRPRLEVRVLAERLSSCNVTRAITTGHHVEIERGAAADRGLERALAFKRKGLVTHEIDSPIALVQCHRAAEQDERAVDVVE